MTWPTRPAGVLRVVTWNVLAQDYVVVDRYPHSGRFLDAATRLDAVTATVETLLADADVVVLQEVTDELAGRIASFADICFQRRTHHPDGVAVVAGPGRLDATERGPFATPGPGRRVWASGEMNVGGAGIRVVSVHLDWDHPGAPTHLGAGQADEVAGLCERWAGPLVVGGDINADAASPTAQRLQAGGLRLLGRRGTPTAVVDGQPVELDMVAVRDLDAELLAVPAVDVTMPNAACPSDHVPVGADVFIMPGTGHRAGYRPIQ